MKKYILLLFVLLSFFACEQQAVTFEITEEKPYVEHYLSEIEKDDVVQDYYNGNDVELRRFYIARFCHNWDEILSANPLVSYQLGGVVYNTPTPITSWIQLYNYFNSGIHPDIIRAFNGGGFCASGSCQWTLSVITNGVELEALNFQNGFTINYYTFCTWQGGIVSC